MEHDVRAKRLNEVASYICRFDRPCSACSSGDTKMEYHDHAAPFREGGAAPAETARPDTEHAASSEELAERFPKLFKPAEPEAVETAEQLAVNICRELYDRFVMGGWQPEEAHDYIRDILKAHAKQRVEQAERRVKVLEQEIEQDGQMFADGKALILKLMAKVADLERERDATRKLFHDLTPGGSEFVNDPAYCANYLRKRSNMQHEIAVKAIKDRKAAESELREMREALADWKTSVDLHIERLNAMDVDKFTNGRAGELQIERRVSDTLARLLARKAGS